MRLFWVFRKLIRGAAWITENGGFHSSTLKMFNIDRSGMVVGDARIKARRSPTIERSPMEKVNGVVVHQTDSED
ncbi:hypothetical protein [Paracidovorax konjaci]|nr:hypothetical protein [Paracidovorax konjaci]